MTELEIVAIAGYGGFGYLYTFRQVFKYLFDLETKGKNELKEYSVLGFGLILAAIMSIGLFFVWPFIYFYKKNNYKISPNSVFLMIAGKEAKVAHQERKRKELEKHNKKMERELGLVKSRD